jgi:hypothetical protein
MQLRAEKNHKENIIKNFNFGTRPTWEAKVFICILL